MMEVYKKSIFCMLLIKYAYQCDERYEISFVMFWNSYSLSAAIYLNSN